MHWSKKRKSGRRLVFLFLLLGGVSFLSSGCVYMIIGGVGAVGGYVVSPDTIEGIIETSYEEALAAVSEISQIMGTVTEEDRELGSLTAIINGSKVSVQVMQLSAEKVKIRVKARKAFLPKISVAQEVYVKIANRLGD